MVSKKVTGEQLAMLIKIQDARDKLGLKMAENRRTYLMLENDLLLDIQRMEAEQAKFGQRFLEAQSCGASDKQYTIDLSTGEIKQLVMGNWVSVVSE